MNPYPRPCDCCGTSPAEEKPETWHNFFGPNEMMTPPGDVNPVLAKVTLVLCSRCYCNGLLYSAKLSMSDPKTWQGLWAKK